MRERQALRARCSIGIQAKLATLGTILGFSIWIPASDRAAVADVAPERCRGALLRTLPLCADSASMVEDYAEFFEG